MMPGQLMGEEFALRGITPRRIVRTEIRMEFLTDLLTTALYHCGYGFFRVMLERNDENIPFNERHAFIQCDDDENDSVAYRITPETMARGIAITRKGVTRNGEAYRVTDTGRESPLNMSAENRTRILEASQENESADMDVVDALAILQVALFGKVVYC